MAEPEAPVDEATPVAAAVEAILVELAGAVVAAASPVQEVAVVAKVAEATVEGVVEAALVVGQLAAGQRADDEREPPAWARPLFFRLRGKQ